MKHNENQSFLRTRRSPNQSSKESEDVTKTRQLDKKKHQKESWSAGCANRKLIFAATVGITA